MLDWELERSHGPKGIGKTTIAKIFAKAVNCPNNQNGDSCQKCDLCDQIQKGQASDILELDAASNNGVENIRNITDNSNFLPINCRYKVYIIDEAHMLTNAAWNALLKTLEEANSHVIFIFSTTEMHKIPGTILSRCQHFQFNRLNHDQLRKLITNVCQNEQIKIDEQATNQLIELSDGSARDCLSMLDQLALFSNNQIDSNALNQMFGLLDKTNIITISKLLSNNDVGQLSHLIEDYDARGINFSILVNNLIHLFIDKLIFDKTKDESLLRKFNANDLNQIKFNNDQLLKLIDIWQKTYAEIKKTQDSKFIFELGIFKSLSLFESIHEKSNNVLSDTKQHEQNKQEAKDFKLPDPKEVFHFKEHLIKESKTFEDSSTSKVDLEKTDLEEFIFKIGKNKDQESKKQAEMFLGELQNTFILPTELEFIKNASQVLVASKNGVVLVFNDLIDADLLNENFNKKAFLDALKDYSEINFKYYIGLWKENSKDIIQKFKDLKSQNLKDLDVKDLNAILKADNLAIKLAKEIFQN